MTSAFTDLDLIAYLYGETTPDQSETTESALAADPVLRHELTELTIAKAGIPKVRFNAPRRLLRVLRNYAAGPDLQLSL